MSIHAKKITLAALVTLGLAACGGGGGGSPSAAATGNASMQQAKAALAAENAAQPASTAAAADKAAAFDWNGVTVSLGGKAHKVTDLKQNELIDLKAEKEGLRVYRQAYSVVAGKFALAQITGDEPADNSPVVAMPLQLGLQGEATQTLPSAGKYTYNGVAFGNSEQGKLSYNVDFDKKVGKGAVTGLAETGDIELKEASFKRASFRNEFDGQTLNTHAIMGKTSSAKLGEGDYEVHFFGPNAEEIAGKVYQSTGEIGVAGSR